MDELFNNLAATTRNKRINYLHNIGVNSLTDYDVLKDYNNIMLKYVLNSDNVGTQSTKIFHIIEFLKHTNDKQLLNIYIELMKPLKKEYTEKQNDTSTMVKSDRYIPLQKLQEDLVKQSPNDTNLKNYQDYLLMCLYILNPALRNDYHNLKIVKKAADIKKEYNYIVITPRVIYVYLNKFKNHKSIGSIRINLTEYTQKIIRNLFKIYRDKLDIQPPSLFNHISLTMVKPLSEDALLQHVISVSKKYFNQPLSINDYRHIWEIYYQNDINYKKLNLNEREALHKTLLHSMDAALRYNRV